MPKKRYSIEDYIKSKLSEIPKQSSTDKIHASSAETSFSSAISKALGERARTAATYGKNAERLSGLGLQGSGLADYIEKYGEKKLKDKISDAADEVILATEKKKLASDAEKASHLLLEDKLALYAIKNGIADTDVLERYGRELGINLDKLDEAVKNAAAEGAESVRQKNYRDVQKTIVYKRLSRHEAYEYALSFGLSEEDATKLGDFAYSINETIGKSNKN